MQRANAVSNLVLEPEGQESNGIEGLQKSGLTFNEIVQVLIKGKWLILIMFALCLVAGALYTKRKAPQYETMSTLLIDRTSSAPQITDILGLGGPRRGVENDVEILRSRTIAQDVARQLMALPTSDPRVRSLRAPQDDGTPATLETVVERLKESGRVQVRPRGKDVDLIDVAFIGPSPAEAALVANLYADTYADYSRKLSRGNYTASREFLEGQVERIDTTLRSAENRLVGYATGADAGAVAVDPQIEAQQALTLQGQLKGRQVELEIEAANVERQLGAYDSELRRLSPRLADRIASTDDVAIAEYKRRLAQARAELEDYYARNPQLRSMTTLPAEPAYDDVRRLRAQAAAYDAEIEQRSERLVREIVAEDGLALSAPIGSVPSGTPTGEQLRPLQEISRQIITQRAQLAGITASLGIVRGRLAQSEATISRLPEQSVLLDRLKRELGVSQETYVDLVKRYNESRIAEQSQLGYVTVIDQAIRPKAPKSPVVLLNLLVSSLAGLLLGMAISLGRYATDIRVRRPEDIRKLGGTLLALIPDMRRLLTHDFGGRDTVTIDGHTFATTLVTVLNPGSPVADNYRRLRTNLQFLDPDNPSRVLAVSSPGPGEGKSVTALNLAIAIAQAGHRVVYVDADLRRPVGHKMMGVPREPGLSDILFEGNIGDFEAFASPIDDFYIIPAGSKVANPSEVLASNRMKEIVDSLRQSFEYVIIDTAPVLVVTDALSVGNIVDATVLVCSANETPKMVVQRSMESLESVGAKVAGVVLNRYDPQSAYGGYAYAYAYGYGYSYGYSYGYGYGDKAEDAAKSPVS